MRCAWALLLSLLLLAGPASACSWEEEPPAPGAFVIQDLATGNRTLVEVRERDLGGDCALWNAHDLDGDRFVWAEGATVYLLNLTTGERETLPVAGTRHHGLQLSGGVLLHGSQPGDDPLERRLLALDLSTGRDEPLPVQGNESVRVTFAAPLVAAVRVGPEADRLSLYDARSGAWVLENETLADLGLPPDAGPLTGNARWLVFGAPGATWALDLRDRSAHNVTARAGSTFHGPILDGDSLYELRGLHRRDPAFELYRVDIPQGEPERVGAFPQELKRTVDEGRVVLGYYSASRAPGWEGGSWTELPGPSAVALVGLAAGVARLRAPKRYCDRSQ